MSCPCRGGLLAECRREWRFAGLRAHVGLWVGDILMLRVPLAGGTGQLHQRHSRRSLLRLRGSGQRRQRGGCRFIPLSRVLHRIDILISENINIVCYVCKRLWERDGTNTVIIVPSTRLMSNGGPQKRLSSCGRSSRRCSRLSSSPIMSSHNLTTSVRNQVRCKRSSMSMAS